MSGNIRDIQHEFKGRSRRLAEQGSGGMTLSYMRGFQAGYEQAVQDAKRGRLHIDNALAPHRAEPRLRQHREAR